MMGGLSGNRAVGCGTQILCLICFTGACYSSHVNRYWDLEMNDEEGEDKNFIESWRLTCVVVDMGWGG